jgi:hypothetical protein
MHAFHAQRRVFATLLGAALIAWTWAGPARADTVTFTGSGNDGGQGSGTNLAAKVTFDITGTTLTVTLQNTTPNSTGGNYQNADVLTAVYWSSAATFGAAPVSAALGAGSSLVETGGSDVSGNLGQNWQYTTGGGATRQGISSSGLDIFGNGNFASGGVNLDGSAWGEISTTDTTASDGALNTSPFVQDTVVFTLTVPLGTSVSSISNVVFQFGTSNSEPSLPGGRQPHVDAAPAPPGVVLLGSGIALLGLVGWSRRRALARAL